MWLVRGMYIVVLLISKGASVLSFNGMYQMTLKTHFIVYFVSCIQYFFDSYHIVGFSTGSKKSDFSF